MSISLPLCDKAMYRTVSGARKYPLFLHRRRSAVAESLIKLDEKAPVRKNRSENFLHMDVSTMTTPGVPQSRRPRAHTLRGLTYRIVGT